MKLAGKYAKSGVYDKAMEIYLELWKEEKNRAAGHNAAILYEVTGNVDAAISLIRDVLDVYPERKILKQYNRMLDVKREQERLAEQLV
jgi:lipopolysaccharide biosynthesis regulator YciM